MRTRPAFQSAPCYKGQEKESNRKRSKGLCCDEAEKQATGKKEGQRKKKKKERRKQPGVESSPSPAGPCLGRVSIHSTVSAIISAALLLYIGTCPGPVVLLRGNCSWRWRLDVVGGRERCIYTCRRGATGVRPH